jgi:hypothetical protein
MNCGLTDRIIRAVLGIAGIVIAVAGISPWGWLGLILLGTAVAGTCLLYLPFGISTAKNAREV